MLFEETKYMDYKFPEPQYLGAKYIHRGWIGQFVPEEANVVLDAFSGSQSIAYMFKQLGKKTLTNDFLCFDYNIGKALVENKNSKLDEYDLNILFSPNTAPSDYNLMSSLFANIFFTPEDAAFADSFRSNVSRLGDEYKRAMALSVMCRSMTRKVTMGHFAHTKALAYASDPLRIKRNRSLAIPLKDIFCSLVRDYNSAVFDNGKDNKSYNQNALELIPSLEGVDLAYFDPPYCGSHADYQSFYHLLETFVVYWKDKNFVNGTNRYEPKRFSGFDKSTEAIDSFKNLFECAQDIPLWLVSYNDRSFPGIEVLTSLIEPYKNIRVEKKVYSSGRGGKGSVAGSSEILLVCTRKCTKV